ncbi:arginine--tRNA ligase [Xanthocytophaga flava]|uniref:arginine--tRNA ligase n=1 Tax=Xanthocytophaga flava TaxID=3048013 RepID=UPI0028D22A8D|nr:arginine--tRNA ligase [Xanthocytophaga flavus]MDJ1469404.1 arginine--tRNA ligase [Xanthocytophaga flavus]
MTLEQTLQTQISQALSELFSIQVPSEEVLLQATRKDFEGSHTFVTFQIAKQVRKSPVEVGQQLGDYLQQKGTAVSRFNVVQGFLNLVLSDAVWIELFKSIQANTSYGFQPANGQKVMVEYSSPNTNKPLHLGHLRNNFLGYSIAQILKANGYEVMKTNIVNDRGIHICKSMLAYQKFGNGETPESSNTKGDKLVGKYYVEFDKQLKNQTQPFLQEAYNQTFTSYSEAEQTVIKKSLEKIEKLEGFVPPLKAKIDKTQLNTEFAELLTEWEAGVEKTSSIIKELETIEGLKGAEKELLATFRKINKLEGEINDAKDEIKGIAQNKTEIMKEAQQMLLKWEQGDPETVALWKKMNGWVYVGFDVTYKRMGVDFDKFYYESNTYLLGKEIVNEGLEKGIFFKKENGSVWIDLTDVGLDEKLLLRGDGTSVYITQDLGLADLKHADFPMNKSVYVVGNEQDYHFKVLFSILQKLGRPYSEGLYHLSYGMVDLPSGKMKSREGTVVDADDLMNEMVETAEKRSEALSKVAEFPEEERNQLFNMLGIGALKYFLLKVDPVKRMLFNPEKSIDLQGNTATFIQFNHARISSILRKAKELEPLADISQLNQLHEAEKTVVALLNEFPIVIEKAGKEYAPSLIANYIYDLTKEYSRFYTELSIFQADTPEQMSFRVALSAEVGKVIKKGMNLLGIQVPDRM